VKRSPAAAAARNARGSALDRRRRRLALWQQYQRGGVLVCQRAGCEVPLTLDDEGDGARFEVDKIVAGLFGGRYVEGNCRPVCRPCNVEMGNAARDGLTV